MLIWSSQLLADAEPGTADGAALPKALLGADALPIYLAARRKKRKQEQCGGDRHSDEPANCQPAPAVAQSVQQCARADHQHGGRGVEEGGAPPHRSEAEQAASAVQPRDQPVYIALGRIDSERGTRCRGDT